MDVWLIQFSFFCIPLLSRQKQLYRNMDADLRGSPMNRPRCKKEVQENIRGKPCNKPDLKKN